MRNSVNRYLTQGQEKQIGTGYVQFKWRQQDPLTGRFLSVDPVTESQESQSVYQYGWNNPILHSDPNGTYPGGPGDDDFLIANLVTTAFYETKHAIYNTAFRVTGTPVRAGYVVENSQQVFDTKFSLQTADNSLTGQLREAVNAVADVALVASAGSANPGNLLSKTNAESQIASTIKYEVGTFKERT